jgi:hypothetical protein
MESGNHCDMKVNIKQLKQETKINSRDEILKRTVKGYPKLEHMKNEDVKKEQKIDEDRQIWINHSDRMTDERILKQTPHYRPNECQG